MNIEIKKAIRAGNSSAVILPRAWLDKEVRVELVKKTPEIILRDVLNIAGEHIELSEIIGVYLVGSYARGEENDDSDIDILIISQNSNKELISEGIYNILIVSQELLKWKLENDLFPVGSMINEAVPLINSAYLDLIKINVTKKNVKWYLDTTEKKIKLIREVLDLSMKKRISDRIIYSLILRIRTLYIINKLITNQKCSKREFVELIDKVSGSGDAYESYLAIKNDLEDDYKTTKDGAEKLYVYLKKQLEDVKGKV